MIRKYWSDTLQTFVTIPDNDNSDAVARYEAHVKTAAGLLERLSQHVDDRGGIAPDDVTWAHVGDMGHICELLREVTRFAFNEEA
jgi:hypothetical protein